MPGSITLSTGNIVYNLFNGELSHVHMNRVECGREAPVRAVKGKEQRKNT